MIDATPQHAPPPRRGVPAVRIVLVVAAALIAVGTVVSLGGVAFAVSSVRVLADSKDLPTAMRALVVDTGDMPVAVRITGDLAPGSTPQARLRLVNVDGERSHRVSVTEEKGAARITVDGDPSGYEQSGRAGELTVSLPADLARRLSLTVRQDSGALMVDADVDELVARTTRGVVVLGGDAKRIDATAQWGSVVTGEAITVTESVKATTIDGVVQLSFSDAAPRTLEAQTSTGDIELELPGRGPYLVDTESPARPYTDVLVTSDPAAAVGKVTARTDSGGITITRRD